MVRLPLNHQKTCQCTNYILTLTNDSTIYIIVPT